MGTLNSNVTRFIGGVTEVAGQVKSIRFAVTGTWLTDDTFTLLLVSPESGETLNLGAGDVTGKQVTYGMTHKQKANLIAGDSWLFSALGQPTTYNNLLAAGNGFTTLSDYFHTATDIQSVVVYQGGLAFFCDDCVFIWKVEANPELNVNVQVIPNIGSKAKNSVCSFGESDVYFLHETGVRSLRVRDASSQAITVDSGSAIDSLIRTQLQNSTESEIASACGVIDPTNGNYWLYLKDKLYVLSNYPGSKILAWSTWDCSYEAVSGTGMQFKNTFGFSINFKYGLVNDVNLATNYGTVGAGVTTTALTPFLYFWIYSVDETTFVGGFSVSSGLGFSGVVAFGGFSVTETPKQTAIVPQKFEVHKGQVFISASDAFYVYGGADKNTYDNTVCSVETSWLDAETPANNKTYHGVDVAQVGTWNHYASTDYSNKTMQAVLLLMNNPTFDGGKIDYSTQGTHIKYRMQSSGDATRSVIGNLLLHYRQTNQK